MKKATLSVFVDESGVLDRDGRSSRFYILALVVHDQSLPIGELADRLDEEMSNIGIANLYFHAGPIIHAHDQFVYMNWDLRRKIFYRMLAFANKAPFQYVCLTADRKFLDGAESVVKCLEGQLAAMVDGHRLDLAQYQRVKVYYDCGQKPVTNLLHGFFSTRPHLSVEFAQAVKSSRYKLSQVADLVCTVSLIERKMVAGIALSNSEEKFFGGARAFKHNVLRVIRRKQVPTVG